MKKEELTMNEIINDPNATIVDVRSEGEFSMGRVNGSINIPLHEVPHRIDEFKSMSKPLVLCCQSGARSGQATAFLKAQGIDSVYNGGGWADVQIHKM
ncbi:MAG: rhodanese-like domain-containing protein [Bacteroidota bacterium]|nr:rhodanese-like domain-containing protein [Bacteroidota bacterium]MDX5428451.1 rhodanese-like domain-containing protein [Bacteroidota bacterium]MDX5446875.1 rhodanese-like domain-containing protein [Bacteroidota bacterium]MDX5506215.1 rhodanese-like domain-containing protein [Bacteroidota bacterium]